MVRVQAVEVEAVAAKMAEMVVLGVLILKRVAVLTGLAVALLRLVQSEVLTLLDVVTAEAEVGLEQVESQEPMVAQEEFQAVVEAREPLVTLRTVEGAVTADWVS